MAQYTINSEYASVFGLDTHARTTTARGIDLETGAMKVKRFVDCPAPGEIAAWMHQYFPAPHYAAYESGCTGFYLCRELIGLGVDCDVLAVSTIARSTNDKQNKNDRKDAKRLLDELLIPSSSPSKVWLPDCELEGVRDYLRCYRDEVVALKRSKQQTTALLLRHGHVFNEKTPTGSRKENWGGAFMAWVGGINLKAPAANAALSRYLASVAEGTEVRKQMAAMIAGIASEQRYKPYVDAFCCLMGVDVYSAMVYVSEIGDFFRFKNGRTVSKWDGLTPSEHSSGDNQASNGHITKAGNSHVRTALVEGLSSIGRRKYRPASPKPGQAVSARVIAECNKCNKRLLARYQHLVKDLNKKPNVAKIAVANEMIRWIWHIGCMVQAEQQKQAGTARDR